MGAPLQTYYTFDRFSLEDSHRWHFQGENAFELVDSVEKCHIENEFYVGAWVNVDLYEGTQTIFMFHYVDWVYVRFRPGGLTPWLKVKETNVDLPDLNAADVNSLKLVVVKVKIDGTTVSFELFVNEDPSIASVNNDHVLVSDNQYDDSAVLSSVYFGFIEAS